VAQSGIQFRRLLFIDEALQKQQYPNCRSLAEAWEVSPKTIQRDMDYLRDQLGAPVVYDNSRHGYAYSEPSFRLPNLNISESDLFGICIAEKALRQFENTPLHSKLADVFSRISDSLPAATQINPDWVHQRILFFEAPTTQVDQVIWECIAKAIRGNQRITICHTRPDQKEAFERDVEPYYLVNFRNEWYLSGFCCRRKAIRTFAVSRIQKATLLKENFVWPEDLESSDLFGDHFGIRWSSEWHDVCIQFTAKAAPYIEERTWHPDQVIKKHKDGALSLQFRTNHLHDVQNWLLSWGDQAKVLRPSILIENVQRMLESTIDQYR
jgi:predicted DNA-binding transcriptional regulator YafY